MHLFYLSPHISFYTFSHLCIAFFSFLWFLSFLYRTFPIPSLHVLLSSALNFIFLGASFDATISLSVSVFIRLNPRVTSGFFQLMYLLTPLLSPPPPPTQSSCYHAYFLSALGWCPLDVISSEISVFLSIDSRSTGVGCRCFLSSILSLQLQL